jgi:hypothetical protein
MLRWRPHVGLEIEGLASPHVAVAPEAADDLVGDEQDVVFSRTAWTFSK